MNRAGELVNNLRGDASYKSFKPSPLPPQLNIDSDMVKKLVEANRDLVRLDTAANLITNAELFISMYVRKEALISSQIEGTQCTLDDVLDPELNSNANLDVADVINYVKACSYAIERLKKLPLCNRLLREIHDQLLSGVRGQEKYPGEFRKSQNWIGAANCSLKEARYIPPNVNDMNLAMDELERYMNNGDDYDPLIRISLIHYQFETIHPFLDGNGRVGRLMILLYLMEQGFISKPIIYISYFLKKNQVEYYDRISEVRRSGNYEQWISFFLEAVSAAAKDSLDTVEKLDALHVGNIEKLPKTSRSNDNVRKLFDYIEQYPIIDIKKTSEVLKISYNTVSSAIKKLEMLGILKQTTNASRNRVFAYEDYLNILRKDT
ncbi:Fic family protein [Succinivibrio sp.]|uniref:Fic family protein n=1 Tax=Succinivibrio sp. TaxID=2053619 RepID=UPI0025F00149|nr:Fic family protein [Succinivibrio sp.]MBQ9220115.1 Fic family protein [Succinivibrio sp.]